MPQLPAGDDLSLLDCFATLSDAARVRLLRVMQQQELSVGEIARALQLPQSTVSRHLKLLHDKGWIIKRSEGTASMYRLDEQALSAPARECWSLTARQLADSHAFDHDDHRLQQVLKDRRTDSVGFFGRIGGEWDALRQDLFGESFAFEAMLSLLPDDAIVADLGCGTGNASELLAPHVRRIIAVDREKAMLDAARKRLAEFNNIEFKCGDLHELPMKDATVDVALILLVLHHIAEPEQVIREAARVLKPHGRLLIVDMTRHDRDTFQHTMGHQHLGFSEDAVRSWARAVGFKHARYRKLTPDTASKGPGLFVAVLQR